eukprot:TRINITY_DN84167_c0_g1_i1.p1 TRINITY_DN84167_c0_g1~~TRINITY_DN84167_c0_g1_i1.p1  ORF type:complete len:285 (-),score=25.06 TRINITY_DN84167_c0_g1_i1:71-925(-)
MRRLARQMTKTTIAVCQIKVGENKETNVSHAVNLISKAANSGASLVVLPECFNTPYGNKFFPDYAEFIPDGPSCQQLATAAKENKVYLIGGTIPEREADKLYNTCTVWSPEGKLLGKFRKMHLFRIFTEKVTFDEAETLTAGDSMLMVEVDGHKVGIGICFDARFPELAEQYRKAGSELLVYPGAFNMVTGPAHWHLLARTRAVDTQQYVAFCSPSRDENSVSGYVAFGHSLVVDPWGTVVAEAGHEEEIVYHEIDWDSIADVRKKLPSVSGKRQDVDWATIAP